MNIKITLMGILTLLCSVFGCKAQQKGYKSVMPDEFEKAISVSSVIRLDVRTPEEFAEGHIAGAANADVLADGFKQKAIKIIKKLTRKNMGADKPTIAVYCRSGRRSKKAAEILTQAGYSVIELDNGFTGWVAAGKPVDKQ